MASENVPTVDVEAVAKAISDAQRVEVYCFKFLVSRGYRVIPPWVKWSRALTSAPDGTLHTDALSIRAAKVLGVLGVVTGDDLVKLSKEKLLTAKGCSWRVANEIYDWCLERGIALTGFT